MRFTEVEHVRIRVAAGEAGLRPASWIGELTCDALSGSRHGELAASLRVLVELRAMVVDLARRVQPDRALVDMPEALAACRRIDEAAAALVTELRAR